MQDNCPECARLWSEYVQARLQSAEASRAVESLRGGDRQAFLAAVKRHNALAEARERIRMELADHQSSGHK